MATFGVTQQGKDTTFTLYSKHATGILLHLFEENSKIPFHEASLVREENTWSITIEDLPSSYEYTYRCDGPYSPKEGHFFNKDIDLIDPYAKCLNQSPEWNGAQQPLRGAIKQQKVFDWENDSRPMIPEEEMILYEMHVRGFTKDPSSKVSHPGTFLGIIEKIPYLKELGINAIELLPIHAFNPKMGENRINYWGYSTINFFSLMRPYGSQEELKMMVKALHIAGIEVILDVVYNHTSEEASFRGIDNASYYIIDENGYHNYSGCGNTFNCNHPIAMHLIVDSLRHFVEEYHIDGFRFDLASILTRGEEGQVMEYPPVVEKITRDPILGPTKFIAEAWDAAGLYQVGKFPSYRFGDWNDQFRNDVRRFIRGDGNKEKMKQRISGSPDIYSAPNKSYNFVTIHDGFTLADLVSYNEKHNNENGENNQDGSNDNVSWNCGHEGPTENQEILFLREKQMKNYMLALMISRGIPMILMGDEYGHSKNGNNNTWCQDNKLNYFQWERLESSPFLSKMITFRKKYLRKIEKIEWIETPFLAGLINDSVLVAFNPSDKKVSWILPDGKWQRVIDTHLQEGELNGKYTLQPFSSILLIAT